MMNYQKQREQVLQLFDRVGELANEHTTDRELFEGLTLAQKHLLEEKLYVVICGEFKQGKSSLIDALVNERDLFPVDVDIATNIVSTITYGTEEKITVAFADNDCRTQSISRREIPEYVTESGNHQNRKQAQLLAIESPNPQLKEGLVLVDTPGVGGLNVEHTALTYSFIPNADAILFVSDALSPLSAKELKFIAERIVPHCQNLIFVITKIDTIDNYDAIIANNRQKLAEVLDRSPTSIEIIPVSSANKLSYLTTGDPEDLADSNFSILEAKLWELVSQQRGRILILNSLSKIGQILNSLQIPLASELSACQEENKREIQQLTAQLQATQSQLQDLLGHSSDWQQQLNRGIADLQDEVNDRFHSGFAKIQSHAKEYLNDDRMLENPRSIANLLESDLDALISKLSQYISQAAEELHTEIESSAGLDIGVFTIEQINYQKATVERDTVNTKRAHAFDRSLAGARGLMYGSSAGALVGGFLGGAIGGALGLFAGGAGCIPGAQIGANIGAGLGAIAGMGRSAQQQLAQLKEKDRVDLQREVAPIINNFLDLSRQSSLKSLKDTVKQLARSMQDELNQEIRIAKGDCEAALKSIDRSRSLSREQATARVKQIQPLLEQIRQFQQQAQQLTTHAVTLDRPLSSPVTPIDEGTPTPTTATISNRGGWADA
ncbi:dynamin family protein [Chamaesiphon polymorphus]|uniref:Dynamin N-terminal domain-containing protein n=1 Tax=Chamaesiphon polymorphus CCALA 037 TaxID=2107692 RepID=A0A2T1G3Z9_9CYAN|nr:dynamin family protein [Chamaesiphon polymorphus]PSB51896.1 hypothetical protein C7B77_21045 [Chamaesiphon polymorphus CCALA 037]